jgi:hypothetical protein
MHVIAADPRERGTAAPRRVARRCGAAERRSGGAAVRRSSAAAGRGRAAEQRGAPRQRGGASSAAVRRCGVTRPEGRRAGGGGRWSRDGRHGPENGGARGPGSSPAAVHGGRPCAASRSAILDRRERRTASLTCRSSRSRTGTSRERPLARRRSIGAVGRPVGDMAHRHFERWREANERVANAVARTPTRPRSPARSPSVPPPRAYGRVGAGHRGRPSPISETAASHPVPDDRRVRKTERNEIDRKHDDGWHDVRDRRPGDAPPARRTTRNAAGTVDALAGKRPRGTSRSTVADRRERRIASMTCRPSSSQNGPERDRPQARRRAGPARPIGRPQRYDARSRATAWNCAEPATGP